MLEISIVDKLIEQGFIVLGIVIAGFMGYFFVKYLREERDRQSEMTKEMTAALVQSSNSNEKLSEVLDKNLQKMDNISTKKDILDTEHRIVRKIDQLKEKKK